MARNLLPDLIRIVDDDPSVCASLTFILQIAGFDVVSYNSADQFLEQATDLRPGCVLLDVKMPGKSGLELFCEIRRRGMLLPVIFLSGHGDIEMAVQALHDGAFDFLVKPAEPERLIEKGMDAIMEGRTVFVIAHRLSTVRNSKAIMVLEKGEIVERGNHEELLEQKGRYYQLYTGQFELE